ncbi:hypothetical protein GCM10017635_00210 [Paracoccus kondratievae]|uniref:Uncharacterized protein n=1 Tax=Paracoccus kondratievae TaxID=135740 RepID=A0AAD3NWH7_9RHOB|nr:hypothetical protein GCM10017635_00210 [Paracoccus kondratievae]
MTGNNDHRLGFKRPASGQRMTDQRYTSQPVQNLGQIRLHPAALPGSKDDQGYGFIGHLCLLPVPYPSAAFYLEDVRRERP